MPDKPDSKPEDESLIASRWPSPASEVKPEDMAPLMRIDFLTMRRARHESYWMALSKEVRDYVEMQIIHRHEEPTHALTLIKVTSAAERAMQIESIRSHVPAESIVQMLLDAIQTGRLPNSNETLEPKERIKASLSLLSYVLPVAKSIEVDERAERSDRKRRRLKDTTRDQLKGMSEEELRQLVAQELEGE